MPVYDYKCYHCNKAFHLERRMTDNTEVLCPRCHKTATRQISKTSFVLKGGGWFADGYKGRGNA